MFQPPCLILQSPVQSLSSYTALHMVLYPSKINHTSIVAFSSLTTQVVLPVLHSWPKFHVHAPLHSSHVWHTVSLLISMIHTSLSISLSVLNFPHTKCTLSVYQCRVHSSTSIQHIPQITKLSNSDYTRGDWTIFICTSVEVNVGHFKIIWVKIKANLQKSTWV